MLFDEFFSETPGEIFWTDFPNDFQIDLTIFSREVFDNFFNVRVPFFDFRFSITSSFD